MKKILFMLVAASITMSAQAKILRVSNVSGSSAPYTSIQTAIDAAKEGDTIMVDASSEVYYENVAINKRVVLLGPGYWLQENGILQEGNSTAAVLSIRVNNGADGGAAGTVIKGLTITSSSGIGTGASQVVISRCRVVRGSISLGGSNCIVHQNFCRNITGNITPNHQISNNIIAGNENNASIYIQGVTDSYIAYNTCIGVVPKGMDESDWGLKDCTIEKNIFKGIPAVHMGHRTKRIGERGNEKQRKPFIYKELRGLRL